MSGSVLEAIETRIAAGHLEPDAAQREAAAALDRLSATLVAQTQAEGSMLSRLFGKKPDAPRGLYIFGDVGRGKTMLMDLFFDLAPVPRKRRVHFHAFMAEVHARIHAWRQRKKQGEGAGDDPIAPVADMVAGEARLLCFDEFAVTDIADAMILGRLFTRLFAAGVTVVATSNVDPGDLYKDGLNRALFLPFIALLQERMDVLRLEARTDFRLLKLTRSSTYLVPVDAAAHSALSHMFLDLTGTETGQPGDLPLLGRHLHVPEAAGGVARFSFADLCEQPLGAADFLAIAQAFHTVVIDGIRIIAASERNVAKRFITLIDTLYDRHVKLLASAEAEPQDLYVADEGREAFEFDRTVSRLIEMRSDDYLGLPHGSATSPGSGNTSGLVET
ncbi:cell division protein ZapE [Lichenihabitans psoromatis]|uniref:cell division protein ZapE n=1 Tax=Lichenihabitans psoromatis TaxID=2528642 RepID=UPI0010384454|nr:cell division protein ZapE [Lichenihabitans psoromatis]